MIMIFSFFFVFIFSLFFQNSLCDPVPPESFPPNFQTWLVTTVTNNGTAIYSRGQIVRQASSQQYTCRYKEQNLLDPTEPMASDYCDYKLEKRYKERTGDCIKQEDLTTEMEPLKYPTEFLTNYKYLGIDQVNRQPCNHFEAFNITINGTHVDYFDLWTMENISYPCQISIQKSPLSIITFAFDGFTTNVPYDLECENPKIICTNGSLICVARPDASPQALQQALDWVCNPSILDCSPILPGGEYFYPDTLTAHCTWAFNSYYQAHKKEQGNKACDFSGTAELISQNTTLPAWPREEEFLPYDLVCPDLE